MPGRTRRGKDICIQMSLWMKVLLWGVGQSFVSGARSGRTNHDPLLHHRKLYGNERCCLWPLCRKKGDRPTDRRKESLDRRRAIRQSCNSLPILGDREEMINYILPFFLALQLANFFFFQEFSVGLITDPACTYFTGKRATFSIKRMLSLSKFRVSVTGGCGRK